uniref:Putative 3-hydroxybutyryl-CoA dehydrogenase n=1 Tax=mine drainage metagenome TaxID=410659 RepID=E6PI22_9ZZZZ
MESTFLVVGAGTMGLGIALLAAEHGERVELVESDMAARARAAQRIAGTTIQLLEAIPVQTLATIALEAVPERLALKRDTLCAMEAALAPNAVLATNTSSLELAELGKVLRRPGRFVGFHFFNPPQQMPLVEIVAAEASDDDAIDTVRALAERLGKTAVEATDTPGFIVNRVARPFYVQALRAEHDAVASIEEIDELALGIGFPMGPFALMDFIGLDINLATTRSLYERTGAPRFEPVETQIALVESSACGRKNGKGFYNYEAGERPPRSVEPPEGSDGDAFDERICILGFGALAEDLSAEAEGAIGAIDRIENDEFLADIDPSITIAFDAGDGTTDRIEALLEIEGLLDPSCAIFFDAYCTDSKALLKRARHPERFIGYGILGLLASQRVVEILDHDALDDEMLAVAQEFFEHLHKRVVLVAPAPGLVLGRIVGSIVNEAVIAVHEGVASAEDVDLAMRLGTNYPLGPIAWGREIGGARIARILRALAAEYGPDFGPHRALWLLDLDEDGAPGEGAPLAEDGSEEAGEEAAE